MGKLSQLIIYITVFAVLSGLLGRSVTACFKHFRPDIDDGNATTRGRIFAGVTFATTTAMCLYFFNLGQ